MHVEQCAEYHLHVSLGTTSFTANIAPHIFHANEMQIEHRIYSKIILFFSHFRRNSQHNFQVDEAIDAIRSTECGYF